ncbi:MAG: flagellar assembly peptidoglycan hydrolase FlgJ [Gammaproteobacteria bacterium]|nr:flagellar assembly peptidoglycan hydrolase FlgJ [Gammaproteobacteria bacterium]
MTDNISMYSDFAGLAKLREDAKAKSPEAAREAAQQFEALFVQMMLQSMRSASSVLGEQRDTTYEEMFDRQIALELTRGKGLGIADLLMKQLALEGSDATALPEDGVFLGLDPNDFRQAIETSRNEVLAAGQVPQRRDWQPTGRDEFVRDLLPHAEKAAETLGVDPRVLVAQAALETGWGQHVIRDGNGLSSNNLFGIKATGRWKGQHLSIPTLEYENGVAQRLRENFRVYDDLAEGFADYVNLISGSERYTEAVRKAGEPEAYLDALQEAGYATDPNYANKIKAILRGPDFGDYVAQAKDST